MSAPSPKIPVAVNISPKVLIACTGSVATIKLHFLIQKLCSKIENISIRIILSKHALHFTQRLDNTETVKFYTDEDEWQTWNKMGDNVLHIDLGRWADVMVISPLSANSLAKIAHGMCDNLVTCTVRAWDSTKPLLFAPAMNTRMLEHPITQPQINALKSWGYIEIPPIEKTLACGDKGSGAMAEVDTIVQSIISVLSEKY